MKIKTVHIKQESWKNLKYLVVALGTIIALSILTTNELQAFQDMNPEIYKMNVPIKNDKEDIKRTQKKKTNETNGQLDSERTRTPKDYKEYITTLDLEAELESWLLRVIECESHGNPEAVNSSPVSYYFNGTLISEHATGLGQFLPSTFKRCEGYLNREVDIFNWKDQVDCMIAFYEDGHAYEWSCK